MKKIISSIEAIVLISFLLTSMIILLPSNTVSAGSYNGEDLALAILTNSSWLIDSSYSDTDQSGHDQALVLSSLGTMAPTHGSTFALFSTGVAGTSIVTSNEEEPGSERGGWFAGGKYGYPRDESTLTMTLQVPDYMHYLYYDVQFFSSEYPEYVGTQYNDKLTITVDSPSEGTTSYIFDVNSGYFILDSNSIPGTGFDIFARSGYPNGVDYVDTVQRTPGADSGASDLIPIGGTNHPVSPNEEITVTINIKDTGDNQFDSAAFIDNFVFTGYARTEIIARKTAWNSESELITAPVEGGSTITYKVVISNTGGADQDNNPGNEFEDILPNNVTYVAGSATADSGTISYEAGENKIIWNGNIPSETSRILEFDVLIDNGLTNGTVISNQGTVFWDSDEDGINDATELTDNQYIDDGADTDGDGFTDDDDPTNITIIAFDFPPTVTEGFSDDTAGSYATQSYLGRQWFETSAGVLGSIFEVASSWQYETSNSFKTKVRESGSPQWWNYTLSELESDLDWWEAWFACGDASEEYDLYLDFQNSLNENIARIKFEYIRVGNELPTNWYLTLSFYDPEAGWTRLNTDYAGGYLRNDWYKLKIEKNEPSGINFYLNRSGYGNTASDTCVEMPGAAFSDFARLKWYSTKEPDPLICPMFFWDDHTIGLT